MTYEATFRAPLPWGNFLTTGSTNSTQCQKSEVQTNTRATYCIFFFPWLKSCISSGCFVGRWTMPYFWNLLQITSLLLEITLSKYLHGINFCTTRIFSCIGTDYSLVPSCQAITWQVSHVSISDWWTQHAGCWCSALQIEWCCPISAGKCPNTIGHQHCPAPLLK